MKRSFLTLARTIGLTASRCPVCGVVMTEKGTGLCMDCTDALAPRTLGYCPQCGAIHGDTGAPPTVCGDCRHDPPPWDGIAFHGVYGDTLRSLILGYKFGGMFGSTHILEALAQDAFNRHGLRTPDLLIPVPLHGRRLLRRGFNQSTEISRALGKRLGRPVRNDALTRIRNTPPQTRLGHSERRENIKDAFRADAEAVRGKVVLLVDDVYTTGATLRECVRTLRRAGAAGVDVLVLAKAARD